MSNPRTKAVLARLAVQIGDTIEDDRLEAVANELDHLSEHELAWVCRESLRRNRFFPRVPDFRDLIAEYRSKTLAQKSAEFTRLPDSVMAMNEAVFPHFTAWLDLLCGETPPEKIRAARDNFLWALRGQSQLHGVAIPWADFELQGIELPWHAENARAHAHDPKPTEQGQRNDE